MHYHGFAVPGFAVRRMLIRLVHACEYARRKRKSALSARVHFRPFAVFFCPILFLCETAHSSYFLGHHELYSWSDAMLARILCAQRIMIIDGAMGTTIQQYKLQVGMYARYAMRAFLRMLSHKKTS